MLSENFQESLKQLRIKRNLTQDELGTKLGVSGQTIYKYENGVTFPPPEKIEKILQFFRVDPNVLFGYHSQSENINKLLKIINNEAHLQAEIFRNLEVGDEKSVLEKLINEYPYLEKQNMDLLINYNEFIFKTNVEKYIVREIERIKIADTFLNKEC
ncbi:hypothetical protein A5821_002345 [Enterococcus sp. 7F3_DIV0205]|uniref:HTH cro/C1-type domain-containing protein n=1 Tax=Candidatus Enterococcus palustris TaxID=1834189 RepID=A0AAQ3WDB9_9ENTE|nr:helix-turn-helix transcriptional regulator [Enterococcus sp. 7F3_DIV0205]OTN82775.1 hypothetical protein A5821_002698 [Enterococcus sp. 7F3_DIV0205]